MYIVDNSFIRHSVDLLKSQDSDEKIANTCVSLLKSNDINRLNPEEFSLWVESTSSYLETALNVEKTGKDVFALLNAEISYRENDNWIPVIVKHGSIANGVVTKPLLRNLSIERFEWGLYQHKNQWNDQEAVENIVKMKQKNSYQMDLTPFQAYTYAKKRLNAKPEKLSTITTKNEADLLVKFLYEIRMIPWDSDLPYCHVMAWAAWEFLDTIAIDPKSLFFITAGDHSLSNQKGPCTNGIYWAYHTTLAIRVNEKYIILDPSVDKEKALTLEDWQKEIKAEHLPVRFEPVLNSITYKDVTDYKYGSTEGTSALALSSGNRLRGLKEISEKKDIPLLSALIKKHLPITP
jgi:hypothetical protein